MIPLKTMNLLYGLFSWMVFYDVSNAAEMYAKKCSPNKCPFNDCVDTSQTSSSLGLPSVICICRRFYENGNSWKPGYESCTDGFQPLSLSPQENGIKIAVPDYDFEALPAIQFSSNSPNPSLARLYQSPGWNVLTSSYLQIDLGVVAFVRMIGSQGKPGAPAASIIVKSFYVDYGNSTFNLTRYQVNNTDYLFNVPLNTLSDEVIYNFFGSSGIYTQIIKITPVINSQVFMRIELYGKKTLNECDFPKLNGCDKVNAICTDTVAGYYCTCNQGSIDINKNGFICVLINECTNKDELYKNKCDLNAECKDTQFSYTCTCKRGYQGDGFYCEDIDECSLPIPPTNPTCHPNNAFCNNTIGSYTCNCKPGYSGDGTTCNDVNECRQGTHKCDVNADCANTVGKYKCTCKSGYKGDGFSCENINECLGFPCSNNANCTDTTPGYECRCKSGFSGNGFICIDNNECERTDGVQVCKDGEFCLNQPGSYACICPSVMPMQQPYDENLFYDRKILNFVLDNLKDETDGNYRFSLDYHAQRIRTISYFLKMSYDFHFKKVRDSFFMTKTVGNYFSIELYDLRCTDVVNVSFPNFCHSSYDGTQYPFFTDIVNIWLSVNVTTPEESRATPAPYALQRDIITLLPITANSSVASINATTVAPPIIPIYQCNDTYIEGSLVNMHGDFESPKDGRTNKYPPRTRCKWDIVVPEPYNVYVKFSDDQFDLEPSKFCIYDYVAVKDENGIELKKYCGNNRTNYLLPVRSGSKLTVEFFSDSFDQYTGFKANWGLLYPRVSLACIIYNQLASLPSAMLESWQDELDRDNKLDFVPVSKLMACYQYPQCNVSRPGPIVYTFEHFRYDRNEKKCIHWSLDSTAASFSESVCLKVKTNKTHTICECKTWGIVAVLGRAIAYHQKSLSGLFELGINCFYSSLLVTLSLLIATVYLFLKDQWGAAAFEVIRRKEFDSGRVIQLHIMVNTLLTEIFFMVINFNVSGESGKCYVLVFVFYYFLQTVFFWLYIYTLFLQSRVQEIFDTEKYNSYKIYLFVGYVVPLGVTFTISGLSFKKQIDEKLCWYLFEGTNVWGFSSVVITLGVVTLLLLVDVIWESKNLEDGIILQEKCMKTAFTTLFVLLTAIFGALALQTRLFSWEYLFALCNMLQGFSIVILYCILRREDPIIKANQIGPKPDIGEDDDGDDVEETEDGGMFLDISPCESEVEEIEVEVPNETQKPRKSIVIVVESEENEIFQEAAVDEPIKEDSSSDEDQEADFRNEVGDNYLIR